MQSMPSVRCFVLAAAGVAAQSGQVGLFHPTSISYDALVNDAHYRKVAPDFHRALTEVGMVTVAEIPGFARLRQQVLRAAHKCAEVTPSARGHTFEDGTSRKTLATVTDVSGEHEIDHGSFAECEELSGRSMEFRRLVSHVTQAFAERVGHAIDLKGSEPLLSSSEGHPYERIQDIFSQGQHLEHFHSYHLPPAQAAMRATEDATMDFHTDQGLCLVFTPALLLKEGEPDSVDASHRSSGKFHIQLASGATAEAVLADDQLVFMLGDGVNQYVNPMKYTGADLRAVPHSLTMPTHASDESRVWYGRMVLPPADAVSPEHGTTFGEVQRLMMEAYHLEEEEDDESDWKLSLGCSRGMRAQEVRQLSDDPPCSSGARRRCTGSCANNQMQCWFRCMNYTDDASPEACAANEDLGINCTNLRDEWSDGWDHGDFAPRCSNSTQALRGSCELDLINANLPSSCSATGFGSFMATHGTFDGRWDLKFDTSGEPQLVFQYNRLANGKVETLMAYNGKVSWLAWGMEAIGGASNGMKGAPVILGLSDADTEYSAESLSGTVNEYGTHETESRFSHWNVPYPSPAIQNVTLEESSCYTAMKVTTDSINGTDLNVTEGMNRLMWAYRASSYMQVGRDSYHEDCVDDVREQTRGGGALHNWVVDFGQVGTFVHATTTTTTTTTADTAAGDEASSACTLHVGAAIMATAVAAGSRIATLV